ncbi:MAG: hypothetical protein LUE91_05985, partial [Oscillospiraceae bacterium]|nr:hypothetical protein [Oscillospiraceae bacterium]
PSTLDLRLNKVRNVGEMELYDTELQFVDVSDLPGAAIKFDVVMDATIIVYDEDRYHNDESEAKHVLIVTDARVIFDSESRLSCNIGKRLLVDLSDKQATKWSVRKLYKTTIYCALFKKKNAHIRDMSVS